MRLAILDHGHGLGSKALFVMIRLFSGHPVLDVIKLVRYRTDFYGAPMGAVTQEAMRASSAWSVADRELMAAVVAKTNQCEFCVRAHVATATAAYGDDASVRAAMADDFAAIEEPLRTTLRLLQEMTRTHAVAVSSVRAALAAGATREQLRDAFAVAFAFGTVTRLADAFAFDLASPAAFAAGAKYLLSRGYG